MGAFVALSVLLLAGLAACTPPSHWMRHSGQGIALAETPLADALVRRARERELASTRGWLKLGHYTRDAFGGPYRSEADGVGFFLAPSGKFDAQAELEATIRAVLAPAAAADDATLDQHPACRFPARVFFLAKELGLDLSQLGVQRCPKFEKFLREVNPAGVTLIFSSYYLNNPSSAFGHTFLRIRKNAPFAVGKTRELLDYGIDFSAEVTNNNAVIYTIAGLTGLFKGTFKRVPYYYKVREYNDLESRDLWEYDLDLTPFELTMLVAHAWEVGGTYFDYFYLGENCSYAILGLVQAAKPELELMERITSPVIPAATVQALFAQPGLVKEVHYRPSLRAQFRTRLGDFSAAEKDAVEALTLDPETPLPFAPERAIRVLDAAADWVDIRFAKQLVHDENDSPAAKLKQRLLERRAAIRIPSPPLQIAGRPEQAPEAGHAPRRMGLGAGRDAGGHFYVGTDFRVALHDLADPSDGFLDGSQIEFLPVRLRFGQVEERFRIRVDAADIVRIVSLSSLERFDRHVSFQINAGLRGVDDRACRNCTAGHFLIGSGLAKSFLNDALYFWTLGDLEAFFGPPATEGSPVPLRGGLGPSGGVRVRLHPRLLLLGTGHWYYFPWQFPRAVYQGDAVLRYEFVKNFALSAEGRFLESGIEGQGFLLSYF